MPGAPSAVTRATSAVPATKTRTAKKHRSTARQGRRGADDEGSDGKSGMSDHRDADDAALVVDETRVHARRREQLKEPATVDAARTADDDARPCSVRLERAARGGRREALLVEDVGGHDEVGRRERGGAA